MNKSAKTDFYGYLANHYEELFPLGKTAIDFSQAFLSGSRKARVLDIGCATGELALRLGRQHVVFGLDNNAEMIKKARQKAKKALSATCFAVGNMAAVDREYEADFFDALLCYGNTLAHLKSLDQVSDFFSSALAILKPGGVLLGQIINFDKIVGQKKAFLPIIENDKLRFERHYKSRGDGRVDFFATLDLKKEGVIKSATLPLLPVLRKDLKNCLQKAEFCHVRFWGDFRRTDWLSHGMLTVFSATKQSKKTSLEI